MNSTTYKDFKKLVIGCGQKREEGAWNIDKLRDSKADQVLDIEYGLPFDDNSFNEVVADYVLCQVEYISRVMNEIHRVLDSDGILKLKVPNAEFPRAFTDPMDFRYFTPETFDYFDQSHYRYQAFNYGFEPWYIKKLDYIAGGVSDVTDRLYVEMGPIKWK